MPPDPDRRPVTRRQAAGLLTLAGAALALPACASSDDGSGTPRSAPARGVLDKQAQGGRVGDPTPTTVWNFQPRDRAKAPFRLEIAGKSFNGTFDTVMYLGYNTAGTGHRAVQSEPAFRWCIEQDYNDGTKRLVESYFEYAHRSYDGKEPPLGPTRRAIMWQFDRETGQNHQFELRGTTFTFSDWETGTPFASWGKAGLVLGGTLPTSQSLTLRAPDGHGSTLVMEHGDGPALAVATIGRENVHVSVGGQPSVFLFRSRVGIGVEANGAALTVQDASGGDVVVARQGARGQRGDLLAAKDERGAETYWRIGAQGHMIVGSTVAPADDELKPGEVAMWLDARATPPKVMFKAKDPRGTVKTSSVVLT